MIKQQFDLTDKVALVVGGRGFLGRRFCSALGEFGARVHCADLSALSPAAKADTSGQPPAGDFQHDVDVTDPSSAEEMVSAVMADKGRIDVLVYSVTAKPKDFYKPFTELSLEGWQTVLRAEMDGLFLTAREVGKVLEAAGKGSVILLSSIYGIVGNDQRIYQGSNLASLYADGQEQRPGKIFSHPAYNAVKAASISMARYLAAYWEGTQIRVNCVSPGGLAHPGENEDFVKRYSQRVPLGRKAGLDEISGAIIYLASDASSYVTGHNLVVDGGLTAW